MATKIVTNMQRRTWIIPPAPVEGAQPIPIDPGGSVPIDAEHWDHVYDGGKNEVVKALLAGRFISVTDAEKFKEPERALQLENPESPQSPPELRDEPADDRVKETKTRTTKAPVVTPHATKAAK